MLTPLNVFNIGNSTNHGVAPRTKRMISPHRTTHHTATLAAAMVTLFGLSSAQVLAGSVTPPSTSPVVVGPQISSGRASPWSFYSCADQNMVMVGRSFFNNASNPYPIYYCSTVTENGVRVNVVDEVEGEQYYEDRGWHFSTYDRVFSAGREFDGRDLRVIYKDARLVNEKGEVLNVRVEPKVHFDEQPSEWSVSRCPEGQVLFARDKHQFICATIWPGGLPGGEGGTISLRPRDEHPVCRVPVPNISKKQIVSHPLVGGRSPCTNNSTVSIELEAVPSATTILLTDSAYCIKEDSKDFWIELRTTQKSTTMSSLRLEEFFTYGVGDIVREGVQLKGFFKNGSETSLEKLSCVRIETSAAPPQP